MNGYAYNKHSSNGRTKGNQTMSWADQFNTYEEACTFYGIDTPAQIESEMQLIQEEINKQIAALEAEYGPWVETAKSWEEDREYPF